jgi:hypothetical protein
MSVANVKVAFIRREGFQTLEEWMRDPNNVYIGRAGIVFINKQRFPKEASIWANPYKVGAQYTREQAIQLYERMIRERIQADPSWIDKLCSLHGKTLGCWCSPEPCHGDVLLRLIQEYYPLKVNKACKIDG